MAISRVIFFLFLFLLGHEAFGIILPEPSPQLDPARYGDVKKDAEARRKFLSAFTKAYMTAYKREFLDLNKVKEDLFPSEMVEIALETIDKMAPEEVLAFPDDGYRQIKKAMDDAALLAYDHLVVGPKADKLRAEITAVLKEADNKSRLWRAESERKVEEAIKAIAQKIDATEQKLSLRIGNLESRAGIIAPDSNAAATIHPFGKTERMLIFLSLGLSLAALFVTLFKRS